MRSPRRDLLPSSLRDGLDFLLADEEALRCFRFMNHVMAQQRIHTQIAQLRISDPSLSIGAAREAVLRRGQRPHSWFTFQLAFILMQLPQLSDPASPQTGPETWPRHSCCSSPPVAARPRPTWAWRRSRSRSGAVRASSSPRTDRWTARPASPC